MNRTENLFLRNFYLLNTNNKLREVFFPLNPLYALFYNRDNLERMQNYTAIANETIERDYEETGYTARNDISREYNTKVNFAYLKIGIQQFNPTRVVLLHL